MYQICIEFPEAFVLKNAYSLIGGWIRQFVSVQKKLDRAEMAIFAPATVPHRIDVDKGEPLRYIVVYAPPGPEKVLKEKGKDAFK